MGSASRPRSSSFPGTRMSSTVVSLAEFLSPADCECLNASDDHPLQNCLQAGEDSLQSDCDEQLIISLAFNQVVKVRSIRLKGPPGAGPKNIRIFKNQPRTLDFSQAEEEVTQIDSLELFGSPIATTDMKQLKKAG